MSGLARIPRGVWALGLVSLCMDLSSELIHALLPLYMAVGLGASMLTIGLVEGIAEATALVVRVFSGVLSDVFRRRKPLVVLGYGLAALSKLIFPLAPTLGWVVTARFADRVGKGIRGAPRDALIAASVVAGALWDALGPAFTFYAGAALTAVAWIALLWHGGGAALTAVAWIALLWHGGGAAELRRT